MLFPKPHSASSCFQSNRIPDCDLGTAAIPQAGYFKHLAPRSPTFVAPGTGAMRIQCLRF